MDMVGWLMVPWYFNLYTLIKYLKVKNKLYLFIKLDRYSSLGLVVVPCPVSTPRAHDYRLDAHAARVALGRRASAATQVAAGVTVSPAAARLPAAAVARARPAARAGGRRGVRRAAP